MKVIKKRAASAALIIIALLICIPAAAEPMPTSKPITTTPSLGIPVPTSEPTQEIIKIPLTPEGNLTLIDDIIQNGNKQFITLQSKNGNYFYLIIDRSGNNQNVYFLNLVDEADLMALIEDESPVPLPVETQKPTAAPTNEPDTSAQPDGNKEKKGANKVKFIVILAVILAGAGVFIFIKFRKKKSKASDFSDFDDSDDDMADEDIGSEEPDEEPEYEDNSDQFEQPEQIQDNEQNN